MTGLGGLKITVDVSLCGSIPRSEMALRLANSRRASVDSLSEHMDSSERNTASCAQDAINEKPTSNIPNIEPPPWACAARGEARLEPVGSSAFLQSSVDLSSRACIRFGRSHNSDVQLMHGTSSRRHAIIFHHPNGNCYVVDCGSAHGTFVNGVRVHNPTPPKSSNMNKSDLLFPHKIKKGALVRFGGPGAPTFVLKSFSVGLEALVEALEDSEIKVSSTDDSLSSLSGSSSPCPKSPSSYTEHDALVSLNTRINALGGLLPVNASSKCLAIVRAARLRSGYIPQPTFLRKRRLEPSQDLSLLSNKKLCPIDTTTDATLQTNEDNASSSPAIVSPTRNCKPILSMASLLNVHDRNVVSPNPIDHYDHLVLPSSSSSTDDEDVSGLKEAFSLPLPLVQNSNKSKRVTFNENPPKVFYPASITPDSCSDTEEDLTDDINTSQGSVMILPHAHTKGESQT